MQKVIPLVFLFLAACAPFEVKTDFDSEKNFAAYKTYAFDEATRPDQSDILNHSIVRKRVEAALTEELEKHGLTKSKAGESDLLVRHWIGTKEKTDVTSYSSGYPYRSGYHSSMQNEVVVRNYTEGTLIVDLVDPKSGDLAWRAVVSGALSDKQKDNEKDVKEALAKAFKNYPPAKKN